jgi:hypothetical protein
MGGSVKDRLENMLNAWQNDPAWYLDNQPAMDTALTTAPRETRERIVAARDGLVALGIYRPDGNSWTLANHRGGTGFQAERLTLAERAEVKRFHLLLETRLVLPGVLVREPQFNYTDYRLLQARPDWLRMQYVDGNPNPSAIEVRAVASPPAPKPLEDP